jgi:hypothetical protein
MHGENGVQIGNADSSKGYDATNKPTSTKNIHFHDNTLIDNGLQAILLDSTALSASANVIIKNNTIIGHYALEKSGIPFDIDNYSYENPPTKEMSEKVFRSIFDILGMKFTSPIYTRTNSRLVGNIIEYNNTVNPHSLVSVNYTGLDKVSYEYDGNSSTWSNGTWQGTIPHQGNALYLPGPVDQSKLKVTCYTKSEYFEVTNFSITKEEWSPSDSFKPWVYAFVFILLIFSLYIRHILKYYF